jgi:hypothetical protein
MGRTRGRARHPPSLAGQSRPGFLASCRSCFARLRSAVSNHSVNCPYKGCRSAAPSQGSWRRAVPKTGPLAAAHSRSPAGKGPWLPMRFVAGPATEEARGVATPINGVIRNLTGQGARNRPPWAWRVGEHGHAKDGWQRRRDKNAFCDGGGRPNDGISMIDLASSTDLVGTRAADNLRGQGADKDLVVNEARRRTRNTLALLGFVSLARKLDAVSIRGRSAVRGMDARARLID